MGGIFHLCVKPSSLQACHHCVQRPLSVWQSSGPACPSAPAQTIILLLIHLSLHCSPNQSPAERDVAKSHLPSCGYRGNGDSAFAVMSARCVLAARPATRPSLVGDNEQDSAVMAMTVCERRSARADSQLAPVSQTVRGLIGVEVCSPRLLYIGPLAN